MIIKMKNYYFVFAIIAIGIVFVAMSITDSHGMETGQFVVLHITIVVAILTIQVLHGIRTFNKCIHCGHERHQHDKEALVKRGFGSICRIICDDYKKAPRGSYPKANYTSMYSDGLTDGR